MKFLGQRGDTIIEVAFATAIIGVTLAGAYNISGRAFRLGQAAKERTQAVNLIQRQAESLYNLRDCKRKQECKTSPYSSAGGWSGFKAEIGGSIPLCPVTSSFHMKNESGKWRSTSGAELGVDGLFNIEIKACDAHTPLLHSSGDKIQFDITAQWERVGGGAEQTTITMYLVNTDGINLQ